MDARRSALLAACRAALADVERAESLPMADWLVLLPDGRTLKHHFAEAATLAWSLDRETGGPSGALSAAEPRTAEERRRRPVLMLTRELRECLGRVAARLEGGTVPMLGAEAALDEIRRLTALTSGH
jgi:hypothetical protein